MDGEVLVELVFMMVILKIPVVYLCVVVYWAIRAEPRPLEGAPAAARVPPPRPCPWSSRPRAGRPAPPRGGGGRCLAARRSARVRV